MAGDHRLTRRVFLAAVLAAGAVRAEAPPPAPVLGEDGLHQLSWLPRVTDLPAQQAADPRPLVLLFERRGCHWCAEMHARLLSDAFIRQKITETAQLLQIDQKGKRLVRDLDGQMRTESELAERWLVFATPTLLFIDPQAPAKLAHPTDAEIMRHVGYASAEIFAARFDFLASRRWPQMFFQDWLHLKARGKL